MALAADPFWNKLCLHAVVRSVVIGNVYMAPLFATNQALFFSGSEDPLVVAYYVRMAYWQLFTFSLAGWLGRLLIFVYPNRDRWLSFGGLFLWVLGLLVFMGYAGSITFAQYQAIAVSLVSAGGGVYFWCSLDDMIFLAKSQQKRYVILILFGCLSTAYIYAAQWAYADLEKAQTGYRFVHPLLFMIGAPLAACLCFEEFRHGGANIPSYDVEPLWGSLMDAFQPRSESFAVHLSFVFVFGLFKHLPALTLFLLINHTPEENEILFFSRGAGLLVGEAFFIAVYNRVYLPTVAAFVLPIVVWNWGLSTTQFERIALNVFMYGYCVGTFNVWAFHRMITQWLGVATASKQRLNTLLFLVATMLLPGDLLLNLYIETVQYYAKGGQSDALLWPSLALACVLSVLLAVHWAIFYNKKRQ